MRQLYFPKFDFRFKNTEKGIQIFDIIRKKFVVLEPEEWVRQHTIHFLITTKGFPKSLINVEKQLKVNGITKRYDLIVFNPDGTILLLVECKAPNVQINQKTFDQIAVYDRSLNATYLMVTNGLQHYYCQMDRKIEKYTFLKEIPDFSR